MKASKPAGLPHLLPALAACVITIAAVLVGAHFATQLEQQTVSTFAPILFALKTQGRAFQRSAAGSPRVLPLYGGSELLMPKGARASDFFRNASTGFQVSPVGKPGVTSLILLEKVAALAEALKGRKIVASVSSIYFFGPQLTPYAYEANYSLFSVSRLTFSSVLDFRLKRDIAARLVQFPRTLEKDPLVRFALHRLASGKLLDRIEFCALWPLGKLENEIFDLQDDFEAMFYILRAHRRAPRQWRYDLDWPKLIADADRASAADDYKTAGGSHVRPGSRDAWFRSCMQRAPEWADFALLLRVLQEIHADSLVITMPVDGQFYDATGVSPQARAEFYNNVRAAARRYGIALIDFADHDDDPRFLEHRVAQRRHIASAHLTAKGWMYYNRALDDFFHGRPPRG